MPRSRTKPIKEEIEENTMDKEIWVTHFKTIYKEPLEVNQIENQEDVEDSE